ncbi:MAG: DUF4058 family protein [Bacteroidota bacterium]
MNNPFPGMNPYLEGALWSDVHHEMASTIRQLIAPKISPKYITRIETYTVKDSAAEEEIGILYPDVALLLPKKTTAPNPKSLEVLSMTPPTTAIRTTQSLLEVQVPVIEIRDRFNQQLITAIEILSPVNKRGNGLKQYRAKREELIQAAVSFLEIDLLRRGQRPLGHPLVPKSHYLITLVRAGEQKTHLWAINIQDVLPVVPVPLQKGEEEVLLDVGEALKLCFERGLYHLSLNYEIAAPAPIFGEQEQEWITNLLSNSN